MFEPVASAGEKFALHLPALGLAWKTCSRCCAGGDEHLVTCPPWLPPNSTPFPRPGQPVSPSLRPFSGDRELRAETHLQGRTPLQSTTGKARINGAGAPSWFLLQCGSFQDQPSWSRGQVERDPSSVLGGLTGHPCGMLQSTCLSYPKWPCPPKPCQALLSTWPRSGEMSPSIRNDFHAQCMHCDPLCSRLPLAAQRGGDDHAGKLHGPRPASDPSPLEALPPTLCTRGWQLERGRRGREAGFHVQASALHLQMQRSPHRAITGHAKVLGV